MSALEDYDKRCNRTPLEPGVVFENVKAAERHLERADKTYAVETERTICWLADRLDAVYDVLENPKAPVEARCAWCFRAGPMTDEAWRALPKMSMDESATHAHICENSPLVTEIRALTSTLEDVRGRTFGIDNDLRDAIRALLKSEMTAGALRRALGELVR